MFRTQREKAGLTQQQLADIVKVDRVAVTRWESGSAYPRASKLPLIAKTLNCTIDDLFSETEGMAEATERRENELSDTRAG